MDKREKQNKRENGEEKEGQKKNGERKKRAGKDKGTRVLFPMCPIFHHNKANEVFALLSKLRKTT